LATADAKPPTPAVATGQTRPPPSAAVPSTKLPPTKDPTPPLSGSRPFRHSAVVPAEETVRRNVQGSASPGFDAGVVVGPLVGILLAALAVFLLVLFVRRKRDSVTASAEGNEMSFDTEVETEPEAGYLFEDEMSGVGSQYQDLSDAEATAIDGMNGFEGEGFEEVLFGF
jgi:hypothetical protein